ncbi:hypothetical protein [Streptomyces sp. NPDC006645]|uniref:hypothetical protein n=1 Tax=unclassified Streptomyces TaxID=2593676 RepID=UPI0033B90A4D
MRIGGIGESGSDGGEGGDAESSAGRPGLRGRLRRAGKYQLLALGTAFVVLVAAVAVVVAVTGDEDGEKCHEVPASVRALADDPAAATKALDPGDDLDAISSATRLLAHDEVCGDGARALGRVVDAGTRAAGPGKPHTAAQARSAYAVAAVLSGQEIPAGLAPGVARMLAEYVVDVGRDDGFGGNDATSPVALPNEALPDKNGFTELGRFLAPGEVHTRFEYDDFDADTDMRSLVAELTEDPEAFAVLYDAERANLAAYLERLTDEGGDPDFRPSSADREAGPTIWPDNDLQDLAGQVGTLMKHRANHTRDGTISDLDAFDRSVRRHTRGTFRPAERQLKTRLPVGDIADRPAAGPVRGDLMDGREQMFTVLDRWAEQRDVPDRRAAAMRQLMDDFYVRGLWLR